MSKIFLVFALLIFIVPKVFAETMDQTEENYSNGEVQQAEVMDNLSLKNGKVISVADPDASAPVEGISDSDSDDAE